MDDAPDLATTFEAERPRLVGVATRLLGSTHEAEDAVQEAWVRLARGDAEAIDSLPAWLTTVVSRICLDQLRARARRPRTAPDDLLETTPTPHEAGPEAQAEAADHVGAALQVVLETLAPRERLAFVLHDLFDVSFPEVADVLGTSQPTARQLASRARRRVRGHDPDGGDPAEVARTEVVEAFLLAAREGRFERLLEILAPDAVLDADAAAAAMGAPARMEGAQAVAERFNGNRGARATWVDGRRGAVWSLQGEPKVLFSFDVVEGRIVAVHLRSDPAALAAWEG